jgi:hypothetical protein
LGISDEPRSHPSKTARHKDLANDLKRDRAMPVDRKLEPSADAYITGANPGGVLQVYFLDDFVTGNGLVGGGFGGWTPKSFLGGLTGGFTD